MSKRKTTGLKVVKTNILAYAVKSDDGEKPKNQILAYAVKSDDGRKTGTLKPG